MKNLPNYKPLFSCILIVFFLNACKESPVSESSTPVETPESDGFLKMTTSELLSRNNSLVSPKDTMVTKTIKTTGIVDVPPANRALVTALLPGYVVEAPLLVGEEVRKGQVLARIESLEFITLQEEYLSLHAQLSQLEAERKRQEQLRKEEITSEKKLLEAQSAYNVARARFLGVQKRLELVGANTDQILSGSISKAYQLRSPIHGIITRTETAVGSRVTSEEAVFEVVNREHLHLELEVFETDAFQIYKGAEVSYQVPQIANQFFTGEVFLTDIAVSAKERVSNIHVHVREEDMNRLMVGMFVQAQIASAPVASRVLPGESVRKEGSDFYAYQLVSQKADSLVFSKVKLEGSDQTSGFFSLSDDTALTNATFLYNYPVSNE